MREATKELKDQFKGAQAASEQQAWKNAKEGKAAVLAFWEDAVKHPHAAAKRQEQFEQRLQLLLGQLPSASEQAQSLMSVF